MVETAAHKSEGKPLVGDADPLFWLAMGDVLAQAVAKYPNDPDGKPNWWKGGGYRGFIASIDRHAKALASGENLDKESGLPHAAHIGVDSMFLWSWMERGVGQDDRLIAPPRDPHPVAGGGGMPIGYRVGVPGSPLTDDVALNRVLAILEREGQASLASEVKRVVHAR